MRVRPAPPGIFFGGGGCPRCGRGWCHPAAWGGSGWCPSRGRLFGMVTIVATVGAGMVTVNRRARLGMVSAGWVRFRVAAATASPDGQAPDLFRCAWGRRGGGHSFRRRATTLHDAWSRRVAVVPPRERGVSWSACSARPSQFRALSRNMRLPHHQHGVPSMCRVMSRARFCWWRWPSPFWVVVLGARVR